MARWLGALAFLIFGTILGGPVTGVIAAVAYILATKGADAVGLTEALRPVRDFFRRHSTIVGTSCALALPSGMGFAWWTSPGVEIGQVAARGLLAAFVCIPAWFIVFFTLHTLYRIFIAPVVQFFGFVAVKTQSVAPRRKPVNHSPPSGKEGTDTAQKRREDVRSQAELFYGLHAADIGDRFTQKMFDDYIQKYMGDKHPPEEVEERGKRLLETLEKALNTVKPQPKFQSLAEINAARQKERRGILESELDEEAKQSQLVRLENKYEQLVDRFLEEKDR